MLETDAPDISPAWLHPARNEPSQLARIAQVLAELRGQSVAACIEQTGRNACRVLPRLGAAATAMGVAMGAARSGEAAGPGA